MIVKYPAFLRTEFRVGAGLRPLFSCFTKSKTLYCFSRFVFLYDRELLFGLLPYFSKTRDNYSHGQNVLGHLTFFTSVFVWNLHACSQQYISINSVLPRFLPTPPLLEFIYLPSKEFYSLFKGLQYSTMHAGIKIA